MRGRGLKQQVVARGVFVCSSPPMRGRGLKLTGQLHRHGHPVVAPHAGAWIETNHREQSAGEGNVAPHAGAWIETLMPSRSGHSHTSPPMRGRGLKQYHHL